MLKFHRIIAYLAEQNKTVCIQKIACEQKDDIASTSPLIAYNDIFVSCVNFMVLCHLAESRSWQLMHVWPFLEPALFLIDMSIEHSVSVNEMSIKWILMSHFMRGHHFITNQNCQSGSVLLYTLALSVFVHAFWWSHSFWTKLIFAKQQWRLIMNMPVRFWCECSKMVSPAIRSHWFRKMIIKGNFRDLLSKMWGIAKCSAFWNALLIIL